MSTGAPGCTDSCRHERNLTQSQWMSRFRGRGDPSRGSVSIESMILVPVFLGVVLLTLQASMWIYASTVAQAAAQDGARAGTVAGAHRDDGSRMATGVLTSRHVGTDWKVETFPDSDGLLVVITGRSLSVIPGVSLGVRESATLPWEVPR